MFLLGQKYVVSYKTIMLYLGIITINLHNTNYFITFAKQKYIKNEYFRR